MVAQGVAGAAEILAGRFDLVATNVPYLARGKQSELMRRYCVGATVKVVQNSRQENGPPLASAGR